MILRQIKKLYILITILIFRIFKIFYLVTDSPQEDERKIEEEIEVVPATYTSHSLIFLDKYTQYKIQLLAFNPAGDGPRSQPLTVRTHQVIFFSFFLLIYLITGI